ncbi:hypothetical protein [Microbacterium sp. LWO13-1.2]|uniref:hypothetical protein n=1 Tax=Microbacterium sp. LWO13-1.2 TaxID=3135262 RepID=UPI00313A417C
MSDRSRVLVLLATVAAASAVAVLSLLRMLIPTFFSTLPVSLLGRLGSGVEFAVALSGALGAVVVAVVALASRRSADRRVRVRGVRVVALLVAALLAATTPGGVIPAAGYAFMLAVLIGITAFVALTVLRRPWVGLVLAAALVGLGAYAVLHLEAAVLLPKIVISFGSVLPLASIALAHVIAAAGLVVWAITAAATPGAFARGVLRHRVAITVVAAACALPYAVARASWLTPWPLLGGGAEVLAAEPAVRLTGLLLGLAMLTGGVLTLGLILPWGERFPRFLAGIGGRAVPVGLAVIPATMVSVLFTAAGIEFAIEGVGPATGETLLLLATFPFWLWGPLLGLSTWGYVMHRRAVDVIETSRQVEAAGVA